MGSALEVLMPMVAIALSWVALAVIRHRLRERGGTDPRKRLPPGPRPLPLVGNLFLLGDQPHRSLARLAKVHGPLMSLRLGCVDVVVVSSPSIAKEVLDMHDHVLSARADLDAVHALHHNEMSMAWLPPTEGWRYLRRLCNTYLFTPKRLDTNQGYRSAKVQDLVSFFRECSRMGHAVDIGRMALITTLNLISNTVFSADVVDFMSESSAEFKEVVRGIMQEAGSPNIADYFPVLRWVDPQGRRRRLTLYFRRLQQVFDALIDARLKSRSVEARADAEDFLDVLLHSLARSELDRPTINSLLTDIFCAGSDTSSSTVEWAMAELLHSPRAMAKTRAELEEVMKDSGREAVEESDISRLPYLQAVLKETLRLHPPVPFLLPRQAGATVEISTATGGGEGNTYTVPKGAMVLVNAWAIGRDPDAWGADTEAFQPERFTDGGDAAAGVDYRGKNMQLIPFGAGRRICPGLPLAARMVPLMLANLLWSFEWSLPEGMAPGDLDMADRFGITLCKDTPLLAIPRPRLP